MHIFTVLPQVRNLTGRRASGRQNENARSSERTFLYSLNAEGPAGIVIDLNDNPADNCRSFGWGEPGLGLIDHPGHDFLNAAADNTLVWSAHTDITDEGTAAQHTLIGGLHMGMRADHGADPLPVTVEEQLFLTGGFRMQVHQDDISLYFRQDPVHGRKR